MIVTVLAIVCLALLAFLTVLGYRAVIRGGERDSRAEGTEKCAICRRPYVKEEMVERQIGDYRLLYFCAACITALSSDLREDGRSAAPGGPVPAGRLPDRPGVS